MFSVMCTIALLGGLATGLDSKPPKEGMELKGTWKAIGAEEVGRESSPEEMKKEPLLFIFQDNVLVVRRRGKIIDEFTVTLHPAGRKGEIDFTHKTGKHEGKTCHAIYSVDGDKLKICTASKMRSDQPEERPTVFSTKKQDKPSARPGKLLFILEHKK